MKSKYIVQIRGNVNYESRQALEAAIAEKLSQVQGLNLLSRSVEAWQDIDGYVCVYDSKQRFTIHLRGSVLAYNEAEITALIDGFCSAYPEFTLTFQGIDLIADAFGNAKQFNDDGTEYVEPVKVVETVESELIFEETTGS